LTLGALVQALECFIERKERVSRWADHAGFAHQGTLDLLERRRRLPVSALRRRLAPGMADENLAHSRRRHGHEVRTIVEVMASAAEQLDERLVHERGGVQRLGVRLTPSLNARDLAELVVREREQTPHRA